MAKVLLTGAAGFVGGAILRCLLSHGHEVAALSGSGRTSVHAPRLLWHKVDLLAAGSGELVEFAKRAGASHCIHAAWYTNHADYLVADINREWAAASLRLAEAFYAGGGLRFVGLGTCLEYNQGVGDGRFAESAPIRPDTLYARCKADVFRELSQDVEAGRSFAWARIFFVYGPGDRANRLIPYILTSLLNEKQVSPRYGGLMRDYIHVDDLAAQIARITCGTVAGSINTGTGNAIKLAEIFRVAGALAGRPDLVCTNEVLAADESPRIEADMARFEEMVGPTQARSIEDGLAGMIADRT